MLFVVMSHFKFLLLSIIMFASSILKFNYIFNDKENIYLGWKQNTSLAYFIVHEQCHLAHNIRDCEQDGMIIL